MRGLMIVTALLAVSACNRGGTANNSSAGGTANQAGNAAAPAAARVANTANAAAAVEPATEKAASASLPENFPGEDMMTRGSNCIVYLGLSQKANSTSVGFDNVAMGQAQDQWESALKLDQTAEGWEQLVGSSVNVLSGTPAAQRDAASRWCVENAPEVDPEG